MSESTVVVHEMPLPVLPKKPPSTTLNRPMCAEFHDTANS
jgi:hypothetical protein